jgi:hypothetical protein
MGNAGIDLPRHALWRIYQRADIKICVKKTEPESISLELRDRWIY